MNEFTIFSFFLTLNVYNSMVNYVYLSENKICVLFKLYR